MQCPISFSHIQIPARGRDCPHLQTFDLESYLLANSKTEALNKRWCCPVCDRLVRPEHLVKDPHAKKLLQAAMAQGAEEVVFDDSGNPIFQREDPVADAPAAAAKAQGDADTCLLYTSPSPRDKRQSRMPSSA